MAPVGAERHQLTELVWPVSGCPMGWPVAGFHNRTVPSQLADVVTAPRSGLNATEYDRTGVAGEWLSDGLAGCRVPQPNRAVPAGGREDSAVGLNATELTELVWPVRGCPMGSPVAGFHNRTVPAKLAFAKRAPLADARTVPSGLNATELTELVWPVRGCPMGWPVAGFHNRTVASPLADARTVPLGLNATERTPSVWPVRGCPWVRRLPGSTTEPCGRRWRREDSAVGLNATERTPSVWPLRGCPMASPVAGFHNRTVPSQLADARHSAVGAERHRADAVGVAGEGLPDGFAGCRVPQRTVPSQLASARTVPLGLNATERRRRCGR